MHEHVKSILALFDSVSKACGLTFSTFSMGYTSCLCQVDKNNTANISRIVYIQAKIGSDKNKLQFATDSRDTM